jgi:hypothetical protein
LSGNGQSQLNLSGDWNECKALATGKHFVMDEKFNLGDLLAGAYTHSR